MITIAIGCCVYSRSRLDLPVSRTCVAPQVLELRNHFSEADYFVLLDDDEWVHTDRLASFLRDADTAGPARPSKAHDDGSGGGSFVPGAAFGGMDSYQRPLHSLHPRERWMMGSPNRQSLLLGGILVLSRGLLQVLTPHRMVECVSKHAFIATKRRVSPAVPGVTFCSEGKASCMNSSRLNSAFARCNAVLQSCATETLPQNGFVEGFHPVAAAPFFACTTKLIPRHPECMLDSAYPEHPAALFAEPGHSNDLDDHMLSSCALAHGGKLVPNPCFQFTKHAPPFLLPHSDPAWDKEDRPNTTLPCHAVQGCELQSGGIVVAPGGEKGVASYLNNKYRFETCPAALVIAKHNLHPPEIINLQRCRAVPCP